KVALFFDDAGSAPIEIKTGISGVDVAGARGALAEAPGWVFDAKRDAARTAWARLLDRVKVEGGTADQRTIMASALYHAFLAPTLFTDGAGGGMGWAQKVPPLPAGERAYSTYSCWDTYRALHPLLTIVHPEQAAILTRDLVRQTQQSPYGPPV